MRLAAAVFLLATGVLANECVTVSHTTALFFDGSVGVAEATWDHDHFVVNRVLRGDLAPGEHVPHRWTFCDSLHDGGVRLISVNCHPDVEQTCTVWWSTGFDEAGLRWILARIHGETHERVLAKSIAWLTGRMSLSEFHEWIRTAVVIPRDIDEDRFTRALIDEAERYASTISIVPSQPAAMRWEADAFVRLARVFPRGTGEQFDALTTACGEKDAPWADDYQLRLLEALRAANRARFACGWF